MNLANIYINLILSFFSMPYVGAHYEISACAFNNKLEQTNKLWNIS